MITSEDVARVVEKCQTLPPAKEVYLEDDFVLNLLETVVDYMMRTTAVVAALQHFREKRWNEIRTLEDLEELFQRYSDDQQGNIALAQYLWGYSLWTRAHQLRDLAAFFRSVGVVDQDRLRDWARASEFRRDFEGRVKGLGIAVFHWLVMRQGVDTVKPDVHVRRFAESALGRPLSDNDVIEVVVAAAQSLGVKAYELDWRIWEFQQSA